MLDHITTLFIIHRKSRLIAGQQSFYFILYLHIHWSIIFWLKLRLFHPDVNELAPLRKPKENYDTLLVKRVIFLANYYEDRGLDGNMYQRVGKNTKIVRNFESHQKQKTKYKRQNSYVFGTLKYRSAECGCIISSIILIVKSQWMMECSLQYISDFTRHFQHGVSVTSVTISDCVRVIVFSVHDR